MSVDDPDFDLDLANSDNDEYESTEDDVSLSDMMDFIQDQHENTQDELASEQLVDNLHDEIESLEERNKTMEKKLDNLQKTIPVPVYVSFVTGILLFIYLIINGFDFLVFAGGVGLICIALTAVYESKVRMNRLK